MLMPASVTFLLQDNSNSSLEKNQMLEHSFEESDNDENQTKKNHLSISDNQGEAILLDIEEHSQQKVSSSVLIVRMYHFSN